VGAALLHLGRQMPSTQASPALAHWLVSEQRLLWGAQKPSMQRAPLPPQVASALHGTAGGAAASEASCVEAPSARTAESPAASELLTASGPPASWPCVEEASGTIEIDESKDTHAAIPFAISQTWPYGQPAVTQSALASWNPTQVHVPP
jgi:hypothetical protein